MLGTAVVKDRVVIDEDVRTRTVDAPRAEVDAGPSVLVQKVVVNSHIVHPALLSFGREDQPPFIVVGKIGVELDVLQQSEPAVRVKSLPFDVVNDVVVDDPVRAVRSLTVDALLYTVMYVVLRDLEVPCPGNRDRFVRRFARALLDRRTQFRIVGAGDLASNDSAVLGSAAKENARTVRAVRADRCKARYDESVPRIILKPTKCELRTVRFSNAHVTDILQMKGPELAALMAVPVRS